MVVDGFGLLLPPDDDHLPRYGPGVSWSATARRVRDTGLAMPKRVVALHSLLANHHAPLGFEDTRDHLREIAGIRTRRWTEPQLLAALAALEESRASHLRYRAVFAERRRREKALGRRQPTTADLAALRRAVWLMDHEDARRRRPGMREQRRSGDRAPDRPGVEHDDAGRSAWRGVVGRIARRLRSAR